MVLKRIGVEDSSNYEVPWIKDFLIAGGEIGDSTFVQSIKATEKGYLILGDDFKGFLFNNSSIVKFLVEALKVWTSNASENFPLYAIADKGGRVGLAVDDTEQATSWIESSKGSSWEQRRKKSLDVGSLLEKSNPFLLNPPPTSNGKRAKSKDTPTTPSAMS